jgi:23S rRNA (guanosine2251-2'-O)-methyltransferase
MYLTVPKKEFYKTLFSCYYIFMTKDFYIYGKHPVAEVLRSKPETLKRVYIKETGKQSAYEEIRVLAKRAGVVVSDTSEKQIKQWLGSDVNHQGVIALSKPFEYDTLSSYLEKVGDEKLETVLVLDHIMDVSNIGAIVRSAAGLGVDAIIVAELHQAPITSAVFKTSAGTVGRIPIIQVGNINQCVELLKKSKFWIVGLSSHDNHGKPAQHLWDYTFDSHAAIVIGNEGAGVREKTLEHCDTLLQIPMDNEVESLNASVTAGIVCYEVMRQRKAQ